MRRGVVLAACLACGSPPAEPTKPVDAPVCDAASLTELLGAGDDALADRRDAEAAAAFARIGACAVEDASARIHEDARSGAALLGPTTGEMARCEAFLRARRDSAYALQVVIDRLRAGGGTPAELRGRQLEFCGLLADRPTRSVECYADFDTFTAAEVRPVLRAYTGILSLTQADRTRVLGMGEATAPLRACYEASGAATLAGATEPELLAGLAQAFAVGVDPETEEEAGRCLRRLSVAQCREAIEGARVDGCAAWRSLPDAIHEAAGRGAQALVDLHRRGDGVAPLIAYVDGGDCPEVAGLARRERSLLRAMHIALVQALSPAAMQRELATIEGLPRGLFDVRRHLQCARKYWCSEYPAEGAAFWRFFPGLAVDPEQIACPREAPLAAPDDDGDGVANEVDRCPDAPETRNGREDDDGCPDVLATPTRVQTDSDDDTILDDADRCKDQPETWNNYEDDDGCPDAHPLPSKPVSQLAETLMKDAETADHDNDGVPDERDRCPNTAGKPPDGCLPVMPLPKVTDSDGDGVPNKQDLCPKEPGNHDGCPKKI